MSHHSVRSSARGPIARAALALVASAGLAAAAGADVHFRSGAVLQEAPQAAAEKARVLGELVDRGAERALLRFDGPVSKSQREALARDGVRLLDYAGGFAFFAKLDPQRALAARGQALAPTHSVHAIDPEWKLHPQLAGGKAPAYTIVGVERGSADKLDELGDVMVAVNVLFHRDVDARGKGAEAIRAVGGRVHTPLRSINAVVAHVPEGRIAELAKRDAVLFIEPPIPAMGEFNAENRTITTADVVQAAPYNLDGAGVNAFIYDGGSMSTSHPDHSSRLTVIDSDGVSDHATHVGGTVGGDGSNSGGAERGMAPAVGLISAGFEFSGSGTFLYTNPGDIEDDYENAILNHNADISNNSIGSNIEPNGFNCAWQGDYGLTSSVIDSIVKGGLTGEPFRIVWAAGNERTGSRCNVEGFGDYMSVPTPSGAKNHISVGALNANDDSMTSFSSWGPTDDGRLIPTITAPGCQSGEDNGVTSTSSFGGYNVKCGTSMASPTVCGIGALVIQDYRANFPDLPMFRNSFLKALLSHTAQDLGNAGPDYQFGYGSVRAQPAIDQLRTGNFLEDAVGQGEAYGAIVVVGQGDPELRITMAWDDEPGTPLAASALVNDLDLVVTSPSGQRFYPWTLDPAAPSAPATQSAVDRINNIEQVLVQNPEAGAWSVEVVGFNVPVGPQDFSLVASPFLVNCADEGSIRLSGSSFACDATVEVRVVDCQLNTSDSVIDTVDVVVASDTNPSGVVLTLTETAPEAATFIGAFTTGQTGADLAVADGDTITAVYEDADDGSGQPATVVASATIDCAAPMIAGVSVADIGPRSATVTFSTDEPSAPLARWGAVCGSWDDETMSGALATTHSLDLAGLAPNTTYFFEVEAIDAAGNWAFDDNGGACFSFTTPDIPDFYTQEFGSLSEAQELVGKRIAFTPDGSISFYSACVEDVIALPTSPSGATPLNLDDDSSEQIALVNGETVSFYGESYSNVFVGANGYVTLGAGDTDWTESFDDHFDLPRISLCFDDLHPGQGGEVFFRQLNDRVAITWVDVVERSTSNVLTGQIEIFFDGRVAMTWLENEIDDFIAGISAGNGLDPDFFESDLAGYGACGPRPPLAANTNAALASNSALDIELVGADDGLPGAPLTYTITSLPSSGVLADVAAGVIIDAVPHSLPASETTVRYAPTAGFGGADEIRFIVDDGGTPPDGGPSLNEGVVSITVGGPQPAYEFLANDSDPGWSTEGQWAFGAPTGNSGSSGGPDPTSGYTGSNVYGYNLSGGYANNIPEYALTTGAIDCTDLTGVALEFQRWLGVESSQYDGAAIEISADGGPWTTVWRHSGSSFTDSDWTPVSYDISSVADGASIQIRWIMGASDFIVSYCGWNIDDVRILANSATGIDCPHDLTGDGATDAADLATLITSWGGLAAGYNAGDINSDGRVDAEDIAALIAAWNSAGCD